MTEKFILTAQISIRYPEVKGTKRFGGDDSCTILEIRKHLLEHVVNVRAERKVVDEDYG